MVTAMIFVNVERGLVSAVMEEMLRIPGITEVHSLAGEYDLAVVARVGSNRELSEILADRMCHKIRGITHTRTWIALDSHYNYDVRKITQTRRK